MQLIDITSLPRRGLLSVLSAIARWQVGF